MTIASSCCLTLGQLLNAYFYYLFRYKPFFPKSEPGSTEGEDGPTPHGRLTVRLVEVTRLHWSGSIGSVRAALAVDSHGWVTTLQQHIPSISLK